MQEEPYPNPLLPPLLRRHLLLLKRRQTPDKRRSLTRLDLQHLLLFPHIIQYLHTLVHRIGYPLSHPQDVLHDRIVHTLFDPPELTPDHLALCRFAGDDGSEEHREEHEVVVLHPDHVSGIGHGRDNVGESHVGFSVG